jgi:NTF2 fold immunity protein
MKSIFFFCVGLLFIPSAVPRGYVPKAGFVPDSKTAIVVAEAVLTPVYGEAKVISERPFGAKLEANVWTVAGTLHCEGEKADPNIRCAGGVAIVQISRIDGQILLMSHGK